jgi:PST family polysaccharide transporter
VISLLYSDAFGPAVDVLRWQLLGDILKVMSWPLGFVILAQGASRLFLATETAGIGTFVVATALTLPLLGVTASGVSFLIMYAIYLPVVYLVARHRIGFRWSAAVVWQAGALLVASCALLAAASVSKLAAAAAGVVCAGACGVWALIRLGQHGALPGPLGRVAGLSRAMFNRTG